MINRMLENGYPMGLGSKEQVKKPVINFCFIIPPKGIIKTQLSGNGTINISTIDPNNKSLINYAKNHNKKIYEALALRKMTYNTRKVNQIIQERDGRVLAVLDIENSAITLNRSMKRQKAELEQYYINHKYYKKDGTFNSPFYKHFKKVLEIVNQDTNLVEQAKKGEITWKNLQKESLAFMKKNYYYTVSKINSIKTLKQDIYKKLAEEYIYNQKRINEKVVHRRTEKLTILMVAIKRTAEKGKTERFSLRYKDIRKEISIIIHERQIGIDYDGSDFDINEKIDKKWSNSTVKRLLKKLCKLGIIKLIQRQKGPNNYYDYGMPSIYAIGHLHQEIIEQRSIGFTVKKINANRSVKNFKIDEVYENVEKYMNKYEGFFKATDVGSANWDLLKEFLVVMSEQQFLYAKHKQIFNNHQYTEKQFKKIFDNMLVNPEGMTYLQFKVTHLPNAENTVEKRQKKLIYNYSYSKSLPIMT